MSLSANGSSALRTDSSRPMVLRTMLQISSNRGESLIRPVVLAVARARETAARPLPASRASSRCTAPRPEPASTMISVT